jgi:2-(1,2-epoxy-1,2-dihydrophenyl)acetyl-CoA isomerase
MLARRLGMARARRFYLLHEQIDAKEAERIGLADMVVPAEELAEAAEKVVSLWRNGPTSAYAEIRRLMRSAPATPYEAQMELETQALARLTRTTDAREALGSFLARRPARFIGR